MKKELLEKQQIDLEITKTGKNEEEVYQKIFNQVRKEVLFKATGLLVEMHIISCKLLESNRRKKIKKFMLFFFPVEHQEIQLTCQLIVDATILNHVEEEE